MEASGFLYDNSMKINGGPFWPQTMDYSLAWNCTEYDCPRKPYRGLWAIPIHQLITDNPRVKIGMIDEIIQVLINAITLRRLINLSYLLKSFKLFFSSQLRYFIIKLREIMRINFFIHKMILLIKIY